MTLHTPLANGEALTARQADLICRIARERGGLSISPSKTAFLSQRLGRLIRQSGHSDIDGYLLSLSRAGSDAQVQALVEVLTTHTTSFFREAAQFDWLRNEGLPHLIEAGAGQERPLVIWSAACSIGAELYTAAMIVDWLSQARRRGLRWGVVGSDISLTILKRADRAIFTEDEITGLPEDFRRRYLLRSRLARGAGYLYRIVPDLRRRAQFHWANLVEDAPALETDADVVFLRNVLIYFDAEGRAAAVRNVLSRLRPSGFLLTGHTESLNPVPPGLKQIGPSIYRKE